MKKQTALLVIMILFFYSVKMIYSQNGCWTTKRDMPTARIWSSGCEADGKIYVFGGYTPVASSAVEMYDPTTDSWTIKENIPQKLLGSAICCVNRKIYIIGGMTSMFGTALSSIYVYDLETETWETKILTPMPTPRGYASASVVDGKIYVIGGASSGIQTTYDIVEVYDPGKDLWRRKASMPTARNALTTSVVDGIIYAIGGTVDSPWPGFDIVEAYDPDSGSWTRKAVMNAKRWSHTSAVVGGKIYVVGGAHFYNDLSYLEVYNPITNTWEMKTPMLQKRAGLVSGVVNGKIYTIGGGFRKTNYEIVILNTVEEYNPAGDPTDVEGQEKTDSEPINYNLYQNYPNPFNPRTIINYDIPKESYVTIKVYDLLSNEIETLVNEEKSAGSYKLTWNAANLPSGVYFYQLHVGDLVETKKMLLLK